jgi:hypothetical protein
LKDARYYTKNHRRELTRSYSGVVHRIVRKGRQRSAPVQHMAKFLNAERPRETLYPPRTEEITSKRPGGDSSRSEGRTPNRGPWCARTKIFADLFYSCRLDDMGLTAGSTSYQRTQLLVFPPQKRGRRIISRARNLPAWVSIRSTRKSQQYLWYKTTGPNSQHRSDC